MPKFDMDRVGNDPIVVVLNGREYPVVKLTAKVMQATMDLAKEQTLETPVKQLALLLGIDPQELEDVDLVKIGSALQAITKAAHEAIEAGNPTGAAAK